MREIACSHRLDARRDQRYRPLKSYSACHLMLPTKRDTLPTKAACTSRSSTDSNTFMAPQRARLAQREDTQSRLLDHLPIFALVLLVCLQGFLLLFSAEYHNVVRCVSLCSRIRQLSVFQVVYHLAVSFYCSIISILCTGYVTFIRVHGTPVSFVHYLNLLSSGTWANVYPKCATNCSGNEWLATNCSGHGQLATNCSGHAWLATNYRPSGHAWRATSDQL